MGASPIYVIYNIFYQLATFMVLLMLNSNVNDDFIPVGLNPETHDGQLTGWVLFGYASLKTIILLVEAAIMIFVITGVNQFILTKTANEKKRKVLLNQTVKLNSIFTLCFIIIAMWGHFAAGLW